MTHHTSLSKQYLTYPETLGKVKLFSDFDGTFLPASHRKVMVADSVHDLPKVKKAFLEMQDYQARNDSRFKLVITTGRNFSEFKTIWEQLRNLGFPLPLPHKLILKNGGDEFKTKTTPQAGCFPFLTPNARKANRIKEKTGWDSTKIDQAIIQALEQEKLELKGHGTTHSELDYGPESARFHFSDAFKDLGSPSPWVAVLRKDGDLKKFVGLPQDILTKSKDSIYQRIERNIQSALAKEGVKFHWNFKENDWEYAGHPSFTIVPSIDGESLNKVHDVQRAVSKALKKNHFILAAGDGTNDFDMLNPGQYIPIPPHLAAYVKSNNLIHKPAQFMELVDKTPELKSSLEQLPFTGIIIQGKNKPLPACLQDLATAYANQPNPKVIVVGKGQLVAGIKQVVKNQEFSLEQISKH